MKENYDYLINKLEPHNFYLFKVREGTISRQDITNLSEILQKRDVGALFVIVKNLDDFQAVNPEEIEKLIADTLISVLGKNDFLRKKIKEIL